MPSKCLDIVNNLTGFQSTFFSSVGNSSTPTVDIKTMCCKCVKCNDLMETRHLWVPNFFELMVILLTNPVFIDVSNIADVFDNLYVFVSIIFFRWLGRKKVSHFQLVIFTKYHFHVSGKCNYEVGVAFWLSWNPHM